MAARLFPWPVRCTASVLLAVLVCLAALPGQARAQDIPKVLVLPFEVNAAPDLDYLYESLPQLLADRLRELGVPSVDVDEMNRLLNREAPSYLDLAVARDLALLAGADYAVYGSFSQVGETISLDARLVEAFGQREPRPVFVVREGLLNIIPAMDELADKVKNELLRREVIAKIEVRGTRVLDEDVVLMRMRVQKGDPYDPDALNDEVKRIFNLDYFEDVQLFVEETAEGKVLIVEVKEKPRIEVVSVSGADAVDEDDILAAMSTKTGGVLNPKILAEDLAKIRDLYRKEARYLATVDYEQVDSGQGQARLVIKVDEGPELYIESITIEGSEALDQDDIKDELALTEKGWLSFFTDSGVLKEELLDRDSAAIEAYYGDNGFLDAKVASPEVEFKEEGIFITFKVEEGTRYRVGEISFRGDLLAAPSELKALTATAKEAGDAEEGAWVNRTMIREDAQKLANFYTDYGYAFAEATFRMDKEAAPETSVTAEEQEEMDEDEALAAAPKADIVFTLAKQQKVYIRRVITEGNEKTRDNVIRREMRLADGDLFSGSKLKRSNERLNKLDYFETVDIEVIGTDQPDELDLRVKVREKSTGMLAGGVGYSTSDSAFLSLRLQERNLFGSGYVVALSGSFSGKSTNYNLSFTNPHVYDTALSVGLDSYIRDYEYTDYDKETIGGKLRLSYPVGEYSRAYWAYRLDRYDIDEVEDDAANAIKDSEGVNWSSVMSLGMTRDTTNTRFNPSSGSTYSLVVDYGGSVLGGDDNFLKTELETNHFFTIFEKWQHVLHFKHFVGFIMENESGEEVPVFERFYLGGIDSVRGYPSREISPRDEESDDLIGGDKAFYQQIEYLFPVNSEMGLVGLVFYDQGVSLDNGEWDYLSLKKSVGTGIRWFSPFGPLRLEYGYALDDIPDQGSHHKVEFSMGQFF